MTLLQVDSSPVLDGSVSRQLTRLFVQEWKARHSDGAVIVRDLAASPLPPIDAAWIAARHIPADSISANQRSLLTLSDTLLAELQSADEYIIGVPMHNFGIPSTLKLWIDQIARPGKTFQYRDGKPIGLLQGKKATFITASGGSYDANAAGFNFVEPYLRTVFGFFGITDLTFINAGGTIALNFGKVDRETFLRPHLETIHQRLQTV